MDQERQRIQEDLRGLISGDVRCDDLTVQLYASDASIYQIPPLGVVCPRNVHEVVACVNYAADNGIPIHPRGAGTGLAGESIGQGLVIDFSHSMRRVLEVNDDTVRIQPGVVHGLLNRTLAARGRVFGPDPATGAVSTMGSVLALDGSGSHWLQYGSARDHIESMQVVFADGEVAEVGKHAVDTSNNNGDSVSQLTGKLTRLIRKNQASIGEHKPNSLVHRSGYRLDDVLVDDQLDMARLLVGSEGTLALITEATVRTSPLPRHTGVILLFFDRLEGAAQAALLVSKMDVSACDLMDRRLLTMAREFDTRFETLIPANAEAMLLVECAGDDPRVVRDALRRIGNRLQRRKRLAFDIRIANERDEVALYWTLAKRVIPTLYRLKGQRRALPFVEDIAVPPEKLPDFLSRLHVLLKKWQVTASLFAHAGHGQLHIRPFLDMSNEEHVALMQPLASDLYAEVREVGGTMSGEHGDGLSRTWHARTQHGPLYQVFREVKRIFDPQGILNPGKVVALEPQPLTKNLRPVTPAPRFDAAEDISSGERDTGLLDEIVGESSNHQLELADLQLVWGQIELPYVARSCNGCGRCRSQMPEERMCPIFRFSPREEATPRAKANLMRGISTGSLDPETLALDEMKRMADLCVNCHQCRLECPADVDIPKLMTEAKAQYVATNGLRLTDAVLTRIPTLSRYGSRLHRLANWAIGNRIVRWLMEKLMGIAQGRKLPRFSARSFLSQVYRRRLTKLNREPGEKVLYFVDTYANYHDTQLAEAFLAILHHNGVSVYVPPKQDASGMIHMSVGATDQARKLASKNVALLVEAARLGYKIVTTEPSAALCLRHEYLSLLDDDDARLVAENTEDACAYLWRLHLTGQLELDLKPINYVVGYHQPCHARTGAHPNSASNLLKLIPGLNVHAIDKGCSGMAGTFGLKRENYRSSLRAGWELISSLRDPTLQLGVTECSACKLQMEQGTSKPTIHPIKLLALAYGLKPEFSALLTVRGEELIVT